MFELKHHQRKLKIATDPDPPVVPLARLIDYQFVGVYYFGDIFRTQLRMSHCGCDTPADRTASLPWASLQTPPVVVKAVWGHPWLSY